MEGKLVRSAVVVCLVLGLLLGTQSNAGFVDCYKGCYISCLFRTHHPIDRAEVCIKPCLPSPPVTPPPPPGKSSGQTKDIQTPLYFCKLGCATTLCANISTVENPNGEKVEACVNSCAGTCSSNLVSTKD